MAEPEAAVVVHTQAAVAVAQLMQDHPEVQDLQDQAVTEQLLQLTEHQQ